MIEVLLVQDHNPSTSIPLNSPADRQGFNDLVYQIVRSIPDGRVMTYGQIAGYIPTPQSIDPMAYRRIRARWVGYALAQCPDDVPWHRVINQRGHISQRATGSHHLQLALLNEEGIALKNGVVDLESAQWSPATLNLTASNQEDARAENNAKRA